MSNKPLTIAIVTPEFITEAFFDGGLANYTYRLAKSLLQLGHKPAVFVSSKITEKIVFDGIDIYRVNIARYDDWIYSNKYLCKIYMHTKRFLSRRNVWKNWEISNELKSQSKQLNERLISVNATAKFDIIHYANLGAIGYYKPANIPAIARMSGSNAIWFNYGGYGETYGQILAIEKLENKTLQKMDALFGPCKAISDMIEKKIDRKIELIESMYIDEVKTEDPSIYNADLKGKKYLLFFGTISQVKGVTTLSDMIFEFLEKYKDHHFVLVGKSTHSPTEGVTMIDFLKQKAGIYKDRVIHINKLSHDKLFPILNNAEFVVLPSRIDNFPNTCIEAMAHSKIVIGTNGNGFEQLIDDKKSGFLVPIDAPDKLLQTIEEIMQLPGEEKKQIEANAKKRIELLTPEKIIPQVVNFYERAIAKHQNPA
jgi:glycosyltransferase involved in cell wall biosynthesis